MSESSPQRRQFLKNSALIGGATITGLGFSACQKTKKDLQTVQINTGKTFKWKGTATWPPNFPIFMPNLKSFARDIEILSGGKFKIKFYGAGEWVPALETFNAVHDGKNIQIGHSAAYYWSGKVPASPFFTTIPFGMTAQQLNAWLYYGGGLELWREIYAPYQIIPFPCGNTGVQMGGWFNKEIKTTADFKGLKMRIPGIGGKVISKLGASAVNVAAGEIYLSLERGAIDAVEWAAPYHDEKMGLQNIAQYYYYPGWHEPGSVLEMIVNRTAYASLPTELQQLLETVCQKYNLLILAEFEARNNDALERIISGGVQLQAFPKPVLEALKVQTEVVLTELSEKDATIQKVYESFKSFKAKMNKWSKISEKAISQLV